MQALCDDVWKYVVNDKYSDKVPVSFLKVSIRAFHYNWVFKEVSDLNLGHL